MRETDAPLPIEFFHRMPRAQCVERVEFLLSRAQDKRVIHLGFADAGCLTQHRDAGNWLHDRLQNCASSLVGLDLDAEIVQWAQAEGFAAAQVDCTDARQVAALGLEPADVVIAGELIEHVNDAGAFLEAIRLLVRPGGELILTTPNCYSMVGFLAELAGYEMAHPDHVAVYSNRTLGELLARHDWSVIESCTYCAPGPGPGDKKKRQFSRQLWHGMLVAVGKAERLVVRWRPFVADGLIVVCTTESVPIR
jgi:SAM-dependent methyltransferase